MVDLVGVCPTFVSRIGTEIMPLALALRHRLSLRIPPFLQHELVDKHGTDRTLCLPGDTCGPLQPEGYVTLEKGGDGPAS